MDSFIQTWDSGPPLENEIAPRLAPRGDVKGLSRLTFNRNDTTLTSWAAYAARRRSRRKCSNSRWLAEVVS